jgi:hypothetical protein
MGSSMNHMMQGFGRPGSFEDVWNSAAREISNTFTHTELAKWQSQPRSTKHNSNNPTGVPRSRQSRFKDDNRRGEFIPDVYKAVDAPVRVRRQTDI